MLRQTRGGGSAGDRALRNTEHRLLPAIDDEKLRKLAQNPVRTIRQRSFGTLQGVLRLSQGMKHSMTNGRPYLFVACMPRTASTFLTSALSELTGYKKLSLTYSYGRSEQELYFPKLLDSYGFGTVTQQHLRATQANVDLMKSFSIRPIILVRDIFDVTISIRDFLRLEGCGRWPTFYCNDSFWELDEQSQLDSIIRLGLPWFFSFYVSWFETCRGHELEALWLTYEEARADWENTLNRIMQFYNLEADKGAVRGALERTWKEDNSKIRVNKGVTGRGRRELTEVQRSEIARLASFYPWVDFSMIGINADRN
jgi:Sulfotransferase domain